MSSNRVHEQQNEEARKKGCGCLLTSALLVFLIIAIPVVGYLFFTMRAAGLVEVELDRIRAAGRAQGKTTWMMGDGPTLMQQGFTFICVGEPCCMLEAMLKQRVRGMRGGQTRLQFSGEP